MNAKQTAELEALAVAAMNVQKAYSVYRGHGMLPAPTSYAELVAAILALDAPLAALHPYRPYQGGDEGEG